MSTARAVVHTLVVLGTCNAQSTCFLYTSPSPINTPLFSACPPLQAPLQVDLDGYEGPVPEFLAQEPVQREVARRFRIFLRTFTDDKGEEVYQSKLRNLGSGM